MRFGFDLEPHEIIFIIIGCFIAVILCGIFFQ